MTTSTPVCRSSNDPPPVPSGEQQLANALSNEYYDQTLDDYRRFWRLNHHFGMHCGFHDDHHRDFDSAVSHMNRTLATAAEIRLGDEVLDAGCGIGGSAIWLAEQYQARVTGITINSMQIDVGQTLVQRSQLDHLVEIKRADFTASGLPAESFDVVWALESSCYAVDRRDFLREAFRLVRPGGRLVVGDLFLNCYPASDKLRAIVRRWCDAWAVPSLETRSEATDMLAETGWRNARLRDITSHVIPTSNRMLRLSLCWWPLGIVAKLVGIRTGLQTRALYAGIDQFRMRQNNLARYLLITAEKPV